MKRISRNEDLIDVLTGEIDLIKSVVYFTHMDPETTIIPVLSYEDGNVIARIPSSSLSLLKEGELCCQIELMSEDGEFPDMEYNTLQTEGLNIWLKP